MSGSLGFGADCLEELNIRITSYDRPGLGESDPDLAKTLESFAADVALREEPYIAAIGFSQGAPFALAAAAAGMALSVVLVAGQDDLNHPSMAELVHPDVARLVSEIRNDPEGVAEFFRGFATADFLWNLVLETSSPHDAALYGAEPFASAYRRCLEEGFAQGPEGYIRDLINTLGPWPFAPEEITVPVQLWYGGQDASRTHSPDFGETLVTRFPHATRVFDPDEGGSILWIRARDILAGIHQLVQ